MQYLEAWGDLGIRLVIGRMGLNTGVMEDTKRTY